MVWVKGEQVTTRYHDNSNGGTNSHLVFLHIEVVEDGS